jgi:hypothetical protein
MRFVIVWLLATVAFLGAPDPAAGRWTADHLTRAIFAGVVMAIAICLTPVVVEHLP